MLVPRLWHSCDIAVARQCQALGTAVPIGLAQLCRWVVTIVLPNCHNRFNRLLQIV